MQCTSSVYSTRVTHLVRDEAPPVALQGEADAGPLEGEEARRQPRRQRGQAPLHLAGVGEKVPVHARQQQARRVQRRLRHGAGHVDARVRGQQPRRDLLVPRLVEERLRPGPVGRLPSSASTSSSSGMVVVIDGWGQSSIHPSTSAPCHPTPYRTAPHLLDDRLRVGQPEPPHLARTKLPSNSPVRSGKVTASRSIRSPRSCSTTGSCRRACRRWPPQ